MPLNTKPLVSIIIPTFNREDVIAETLQSVINQTYNNWEIIIVDDGSTDKTYNKILNFIEQYPKQIKFFNRTTVKKGGSVCRNIGIEKSNGDFIIFLDSDDVLASWCLEQRVNAILEFPELDFGIFHAETFTKTPGDGKLHTVFLASKNHLYHFIAGHNIWQTSCPIWKKNYVIKLGGFNENYQRFQDTEFHFRALQVKGNCYKAFYKLKPDCYYRLTYLKRPASFWNVVVENNVLYLNEVIAAYAQYMNMYLYKASIKTLISFAVVYSIRAQHEKAEVLLKAIDNTSVKNFLSAKIFSIFKAIILLHKKQVLKFKPAKRFVSRLLFLYASKQIKKIA